VEKERITGFLKGMSTTNIWKRARVDRKALIYGKALK
jgi:hypothetical protein